LSDEQGNVFPEGEALRCSNEGAEILGTVAVVQALEEGTPWAWGEMTALPMMTYQSTRGEFVLLHPKCLHDVIDEIFRAESMAAIAVSLGPVDEIRAALVM
jgi:hypothetical protein